AGWRPSPRAIVVLGVGLAALAVAGLISGAPPPATDYERELGRIHASLADVTGARTPPGDDAETTLALLHLLHRRALLTGSLADLRVADAALVRARERPGGDGRLWLLEATHAMATHRLTEVRRVLPLLAAFGDTSEIELLHADLALQEGRYEAAR